MENLVTSNMKLAYKAVANFCKGKKVYDREELIGVALYGLCLAARDYEAERKTKFSSFAYKRIMWEIVKSFKFQKAPTKIPSKNSKKSIVRENFDYRADESFLKHKTVCSFEAEVDNRLDYDKVMREGNVKNLSDRQREVVEALYSNRKPLEEGKSRSEVGKDLGISKSALYNLEKRAIKNLSLTFEKDIEAFHGRKGDGF